MDAMVFDTTDAPIPLGDYVPAADQRIVMHNVAWEGYEALLALRGDQRRPRMTYLDGAVELMTTSEHHERIRFLLGRLLERYVIALGASFVAYGQTTYKKQREAGLEADECYVIGEPRNDRPDLAIEVVWTSGGISKLEVYEPLGVPEVWMWKSGVIRVHVLGDRGYEEREHSVLLPAIDLAFLASFLDRPASARSLVDFDAALAEKLAEKLG
jgi:Uma2 family endonuclease